MLHNALKLSIYNRDTIRVTFEELFSFIRGIDCPNIQIMLSISLLLIGINTNEGNQGSKLGSS